MSDTHGLRIWEGLLSLMKTIGRKPSAIEGAAWIDEYIATASLKLKRVRATPGDPRPKARDAVFDALSELSGVPDTRNLTRAGASAIAAAKKQILEVMPGASAADVVAEIRARAERYKRVHREWTFTVPALAKRWAELAPQGAERRDLPPIAEPAGFAAWHEQHYGTGPRLAWAEYDRERQEYILKQMRQHPHRAPGHA